MKSVYLIGHSKFLPWEQLNVDNGGMTRPFLFLQRMWLARLTYSQASYKLQTELLACLHGVKWLGNCSTNTSCMCVCNQSWHESNSCDIHALGQFLPTYTAWATYLQLYLQPNHQHSLSVCKSCSSSLAAYIHLPHVVILVPRLPDSQKMVWGQSNSLLRTSLVPRPFVGIGLLMDGLGTRLPASSRDYSNHDLKNESIRFSFNTDMKFWPGTTARAFNIWCLLT